MNATNTSQQQRVVESRQPPRPILLTGSHRSGSTWVGKKLGTAPEAAYIQEPFNPNHGTCGTCGLRFDWWYQCVTGRERAFTDHIDHLLGRREGRPLIEDPLALLSAEWLATEFSMQVMVLIRYPAAFASSLKRLNWEFPFDHLLNQRSLMDFYLAPYKDQVEDFVEHPRNIIEQAALLWKILHHRILQYRESHPGWIFLRHEDLCANPARGFEASFQRLGLNFDAAVREKIIELSSPSHPDEAPPGQARFLTRNSKANISNWKQRLSRAEISTVRSITGPVAAAFYSGPEW